MTYALKPLPSDPARIKGMSEKLIVSHYENNYGGAVNRLNAMTGKSISLRLEPNMPPEVEAMVELHAKP